MWKFPVLSYFMELLSQLYGPITYTPYEDRRYRELKERYRRKWEEAGVPEHWVKMALRMAEEWAEKLTGFHLRQLRGILPEDELKKIERDVLIKFYETGLNNAESWLEKMIGKEL